MNFLMKENSDRNEFKEYPTAVYPKYVYIVTVA